MTSNFEFLTIDLDTAELFRTVNAAEENYTHNDFEGTLTKVRKVAENTALLIADKEYIEISSYKSFHNVLKNIKKSIKDKKVVDYFYEIKGKGNTSAHELNPKDATQDSALGSLEQIFYILAWYVTTYVDVNIKVDLFEQFLEPRAQEMYSTAERKFIYVQNVNNESGYFDAYDGVKKIGEGTISADDLEADWSPNSDFLRSEAPKRINQYMTTSGLPYLLGWVELAYRKSTKTWFHDYDVHNILKRSGIKKPSHIMGNEWFNVDLETAKSAIKAVKEGKNHLNTSLPNVMDETPIILRPEQRDAIQKTHNVFKKKDRMLWNAKMRFGKTLTTLQLIKTEGFQKVLILTHRPVVADSWFDDFYKMNMNKSGYNFGSSNKGETLEKLKFGDQSFIYFASIQLLRHNNAQTNLTNFSKIDWDLIVIDEAHEGTQTELSEVVLKELIKDNTKLLELSGTPFNILDQFDSEQVYTWDYVMEQSAKVKWELEKPDQPNPYETLPKISMYTFEMKDKERFSDETKSFNFKEFFKVNQDGRFVYQQEVFSFLNNITDSNDKTNYPFATKKFREELRHTLWLMPGVKEANALENLLNTHPIFGKEYKIVNVVRGTSNDNGIARAADLEKVRNAITEDPSKTKTITLTVRKLTTGVNIPEWTAVMFLSNTSSAINYLQAAFRAQTPFSHEILGMKKNCYIFDFAPDRALKIMAESAQINSGVGKKNTEKQKQSMTQLLNFMPILGDTENGMKPLSVDNMLTQLKKVYAEKAVRSGFEDDSLYNDRLLTLTADDAEMFSKINAVVGKSQTSKAKNVFVVNENGLTDEEYNRAERSKKKASRERTDDEKKLLEKLKEAKKQRRNMISILRGVSIRIPMMIYGMEMDLSTDITVETFLNAVDRESWNEFMPKGFTKGMFSEIIKYYDAEVFIEAGRIIRQRAKSFDSLDFIDRAENIAELFSTFKNPDKETVLTPWRVVNIQINTVMGGLNFYDNNFESTTQSGVPNLHWVDTDLTSSIYQKTATILDINSKTGLYPLHSAISLYYKMLLLNTDKRFDANKIYKDILANNIYAIAKTPMAKTITERTLKGYNNYKTNVIYIENFTNNLKKDITNETNIVKEAFGNVKFDVIIGNPPYQESATDKEMVAGQQQRVTPVFQLFQQIADSLNPRHSVLIYPGGRWMQQSGRGLQEFGNNLINSKNLSHLIYYPNANEIFGEVAISDGISIVHKDYSKNTDKFNYSLIKGGEVFETERKYPGESTFLIYPTDEQIVNKLRQFVDKNDLQYLSSSPTINQKLFQIESNFVEKNPDKVSIYEGQNFDRQNQIKLLVNDKAGKSGRAKWFIADRDVVKVRKELIDKYKVVVSSANAGGQKRDNQLTILQPQTAFGRSRLALKVFDTSEEAKNFYNYVKSYFIRFTFLLTDENLSSLGKLVPDLLDYTNNKRFFDFTKDIDNQFIEMLNLTSEEIDRIKSRVDNLRS